MIFFVLEQIGTKKVIFKIMKNNEIFKIKCLAKGLEAVNYWRSY